MRPAHRIPEAYESKGSREKQSERRPINDCEKDKLCGGPFKSFQSYISFLRTYVEKIPIPFLHGFLRDRRLLIRHGLGGGGAAAGIFSARGTALLLIRHHPSRCQVRSVGNALAHGLEESCPGHDATLLLVLEADAYCCCSRGRCLLEGSRRLCNSLGLLVSEFDLCARDAAGSLRVLN